MSLKRRHEVVPNQVIHSMKNKPQAHAKHAAVHLQSNTPSQDSKTHKN